MTDSPSKNDLEIVPNEYAKKDYEVNVSIPEFNCICPRTGLPDFATIKINYIPDKFIEIHDHPPSAIFPIGP